MFGAVAAPAHPCWWCVHWDGVDSSGAAALCKAPRAARVRSQPDRGCSLFEREPGCDDQPDWTPIRVTSTPAVWTPGRVPPPECPPKWAP